jgi:hypothetical protein
VCTPWRGVATVADVLAMAFSRGERSTQRRRDVPRQRLRILFIEARALAVEYESVGEGVHLLSFLGGCVERNGLRVQDESRR